MARWLFAWLLASVVNAAFLQQWLEREPKLLADHGLATDRPHFLSLAAAAGQRNMERPRRFFCEATPSQLSLGVTGVKAVVSMFVGKSLSMLGLEATNSPYAYAVPLANSTFVQAAGDDPRWHSGYVGDVCLLGLSKYAWAFVMTLFSLLVLVACVPFLLQVSRRRPPGQKFFTCGSD